MNRQQVTAASEWVNGLLVRLSATLLTAGVLIIILNVASRYMLHLSLTWSADLSRYLIIWSALLAAVVLSNRQEHLRIDLLGSWLGRGNRLLDIGVTIGCMTFYLVMLVSGCVLVSRTAGQVAPSMEFLPMSAVYSIMPLSGLLMWLGGCVNLFQLVFDEKESA